MGEYIMYKRWLKEEDEILTRLVQQSNSIIFIAAELNRTVGSVQSRISRLGLCKYHREVVTVIPGEKWKYISGFTEYKISNLGRISRDGYILSQGKNSRGYMGVVLSGKSKEVHRLVAYHFIDDTIDKTMDINHIDFDTTNNSVSNLEIITRRENITHSVKAERNLNNVPDKALHYICSKLEEGRTDYSALVQETNALFNLTIFNNYITALLTKDMRQYITKNYKLPTIKKANRVTDELVHNICKVLESGNIQTSYKDVLIAAEAAGIVADSYIGKLFDGRKKHITSLYNIENGRITSRWQHLKGSTTIPNGSTVK
jgi:hypothetical protein